jgi:hypothetical protein
LKSVLIISYTFPPYSGIGGRRWAKFAKYLSGNNKVYVISSKNPLKDISSWNKDAEGIEQHQLSINYPLPLITFPKSIIGRISYKLSLLKVKLLSKGNYYDKTIFWKRDLQTKCSELIQKYDIKNVVCSVGPFNMSQYIIELKDRFPDVNFILDYRDPWTNNRTSFGFTSISDARLSYEKEIEKSVLKKFDLVTGVSKQFSEYFKELTESSDFDKKYIALPNGYDEQDLKDVAEFDFPKFDPDDIVIVFAGTFYDKSIGLLKQLVETIKQLNTTEQVDNNLKFVFLGAISQQGLALLKQHPAFFYLGEKSLQEAYYAIEKADYCSLFLTDDLDYSFSTKFYEYLAKKKRVLTFSAKHGYNAQFIEEHNIGYGVNYKNMNEKLLHISKHGKPLPVSESDFNISKFDVKNLTLELERLLK